MSKRVIIVAPPDLSDAEWEDACLGLSRFRQGEDPVLAVGPGWRVIEVDAGEPTGNRVLLVSLTERSGVERP